ncbi:MAG: hypothetical protein ACSLE1_12465 [Sphingobium sp.]
MPLILSLVPLAVGVVLPRTGVHWVLLMGAAICLLAAVLVVLLVVERPALMGQVPMGGEATTDATPAASGGTPSCLANWRFWALALGLGGLSASGNAFIAHVVPFGMESGLTLQQA